MAPPKETVTACFIVDEGIEPSQRASRKLSVAGSLRIVDFGCQLVPKSNAYQITASPNDLATANIVEIIECKFKVQGQDIEILQLNSCTAFRYVADAARKDAALLVEEQQRILRDCRSGDGSSFDHETSIESNANSFSFRRIHVR
jgi:hypothetical protein